MKILLRSVLLILLLFFILPLNAVYAVPPTAQTFYGSVTLDGSPAPDGTSVTAEMNGRTAGSDSTSGGQYSLIIQTIEGDNAGDTITFFVNGINAGSTTLNPGAITQLNLSVNTPHTLTILTSGNGSTTGAGTYDKGTEVPIGATPASGWEFVNWTGDTGTIADTNSANTTITMNADYTITANFTQLPTHTLTMAVTGNGSTNPPVGDHVYPEGTVVNITAIPDAGWQFDSWTGDVFDANSADTTVTMNADKTVTANFSQLPPVTLTMAVSGNGSTTPEVGTHEYPQGTKVEITATPDPGNEFAGWSGDVADPNSATTTVTMDADKTVTANFSQLPTSTLTIVVNGNGSTQPSAGSHEYPTGAVVDITATPDPGWQFDSWTGDVATVGDVNLANTTITMNADYTITANFSLVPDNTPPTTSNIQATNATRTSVDISWTTDEPGTSQVDYSASPGELSPLDATLVTQHLVHLTGLNPATTYYYRVMSRDAAGNLSVSGELTFTTLATPATFITGDWSVAITEVDSGQEATITFTITNTGEQAGTYEVALAVNGAVESTEELSLEPGASEKITFVTTKSATGTYTVTVNGLSFSFEVPEEAAPVIPPDGGPGWWLVIILAIIAVLLVAALVITVLADRGRLGSFRWPLLAPRGVPGQYYDEAMTRSRIEAAAQEKDRLRTTAYAEEPSRFEGEVDEDEEKKQIAADKAREQWAKMEAEAEARRAEAEKKSPKIKGEAAEAEGGMEKTPPVKPEDTKVAGVLTVTALASKKLKEAVQAKTADPTMGFRLTRSPDKPNQLKMTLDKATAEDQVVKSEGVTILIIDPKLIPTLEGMVIDYNETPQGGSLSITRRSPGR